MQTDNNELEHLNDFLRFVADSKVGIRRKIVMLNRYLQHVHMRKDEK